MLSNRDTCRKQQNAAVHEVTATEEEQHMSGGTREKEKPPGIVKKIEKTRMIYQRQSHMHRDDLNLDR